MRKNLFKSSADAALVEQFTAIELEQFQAELEGDIGRQKKCAIAAMEIAAELKSRPGDQRSELLKLYDHPNVQVRLMAAKLTLAVAPTAARGLLQLIADSKQYPQAMDAGMSLWALDQGIAPRT
jgi:hypothetical protein